MLTVRACAARLLGACGRAFADVLLGTAQADHHIARFERTAYGAVDRAAGRLCGRNVGFCRTVHPIGVDATHAPPPGVQQNLG